MGLQAADEGIKGESKSCAAEQAVAREIGRKVIFLHHMGAHMCEASGRYESPIVKQVAMVGRMHPTHHMELFKRKGTRTRASVVAVWV